jgi:formylglycine-generating enzyme required for sulfatase activity
LLVQGGTYERSNDPNSSATISPFRLDRFEATVGRFRGFVNAVISGWQPQPGSGKHTHLNGGNGLANVGDAGLPFEQGWDATWNANLANDASAWNAALACHATYPTWTHVPGPNETRPIVCPNWFEAFAFCIWDGGFLPSEAEWNLAAAGGSDQRQYPWSSPASSTTVDCSFANYSPGAMCSPIGVNAVGTESPKGDGKWGQADLAGNAREWSVDWYVSPYASPCTNCAVLGSFGGNGYRVIRGGSFHHPAAEVLTSYRDSRHPTDRAVDVGIRCARAP